MNINISAKIKRMSLRRQKIAIAKLIHARIAQLGGGKLNRMLLSKADSTLYADVCITPRLAIEKINIEFTIQKTPS